MRRLVVAPIVAAILPITVLGAAGPTRLAHADTTHLLVGLDGKLFFEAGGPATVRPATTPLRSSASRTRPIRGSP